MRRFGKPSPHAAARGLLTAALLAGGSLTLTDAAADYATLGPDPSRYYGTDPAGRMLLYSPDPVELGSSLSHWDTSATPSLLMEPRITSGLPFLGLDLTPMLLNDIGWSSGSSNIVITSLDPAGTGLDDPTPFGGAPGNAATTLGDARRNVIDAVLSAWADELDSTVDIDVMVTWTSLFCAEGGGAVLGAASTTYVFYEEAGSPGAVLPYPETWYGSALAESYFGVNASGDPTVGDGDIIVILNADLDNECLGAGTGFYYGLDGNPGATQIDLAPVILHELGHGLGFANTTDEWTGELLYDRPNVYDVFTYDVEQSKDWAHMTDAERAASARNFRNVIWSGAQTTAQVPATLDLGHPSLRIAAPSAAAGHYEMGPATFGADAAAETVSAPLACALDRSFPNPADGCSRSEVSLSGTLAIVERGNCTFAEKAALAQQAGAAGLLIINSPGQNMAFNPGGSDPSITIPVAGIGYGDGQVLRQAVCPNQIPVASGFSLGILASLLGLLAWAATWRRRRA